jgi:hypothetical protein
MPALDFENTDKDDYAVGSAELRRMFGGVSHMFVERRLKDDPTFPKPFYVKNRRFWFLKELRAWQRILRQRPHQRNRVERAAA